VQQEPLRGGQFGVGLDDVDLQVPCLVRVPDLVLYGVAAVVSFSTSVNRPSAESRSVASATCSWIRLDAK